MVAITGHFDGKVIVPDEPVNLPPGQRLLLHIEPAQPIPPKIIQPGSAVGQIELSEDFDAPLDELSDYRE